LIGDTERLESRIRSQFAQGNSFSMETEVREKSRLLVRNSEEIRQLLGRLREIDKENEHLSQQAQELEHRIEERTQLEKVQASKGPKIVLARG